MSQRATSFAPIEVLELFNEKVDLIQASRFFCEVKKSGGAIVEWKEGQGWDGIYVGPEEDSIASFILTLRLFIQNNETISLCNVNTLYQALPVRKELKDEFATCREELNGFLDTPTNLSIKEGQRQTFREIVHIFVYGCMAHVNQADLRRTYVALSKTPFFPLYQDTFIAALRVFVHALFSMRRTNQKALLELGDAEESSVPDNSKG